MFKKPYLTCIFFILSSPPRIGPVYRLLVHQRDKLQEGRGGGKNKLTYISFMYSFFDKAIFFFQFFLRKKVSFRGLKTG